MLDLRGKAAIITGGATGIGFGLAKACGERGAHVVIGEPRQSRLDEAVECLAAAGVTARAFPLDVTDPCLLYTSPSPRDGLLSRMPSSA